MSSGVISSQAPGDSFQQPPRGKRLDETLAFDQQPVRDVQEKFTIQDIQRRLKIVFGLINGVNEHVDEAMHLAQEAADEWKLALEQKGQPPTADEYTEKYETSFKWNLARLELRHTKKDEDHKELLAGRTADDTEEGTATNSVGEHVPTKPRQRWEFTKERIRDVLDPAIPDSELETFIDDGHGDDHGGQGFVHMHPGRKLVTKHLNPTAQIDDRGWTRKDREVMSLKHLHSVDPTIAPEPLGEGREGNRDIIFMEQASGDTLEKLLTTLHKLPIEEQSGVCIKLIDLLKRTHTSGLLHRDIKPANIMLDRETEIAKLLDFGLARVRHNDARSSKNLPVDLTMTQAGQVLGSVLYMSPRQAANSSSIDPRNDLYSLGLVLYKLLSGLDARTMPKDEVEMAKMIEEMRAPGFVEKLPALYGDIRQTDGTVVKQLPPEAAQAIEILLGLRKVFVPEEQLTLDLPASQKTKILDGAAAQQTIAFDTAQDAVQQTVDFNPAELNGVQAQAVNGATVDFQPAAPGQTIDAPAGQAKPATAKIETTEERRAWREADAMAREAIAYFDTLAAGKGNAKALVYKRRAESLLSSLWSFAKKPWVIAAEVAALGIGSLLGGNYLLNRKPVDPSEVIVREAEEPDPEHFNVSSQKTYGDGHKDLSFMMPAKTGIAPIHMKSGMDFLRVGPDGKETVIGFTTAIPKNAREHLFGAENSKMYAESYRVYHLIDDNPTRGTSTFTWGGSGATFFRPAGKKSRASYAPAQPNVPNLVVAQNFPIVQNSEKTGEWFNGMLSDPEFQEFILSVVVDGVTPGKINSRVFVDADIDALSEAKTLNIFISNIKQYQSTVLKIRELKAKQAGKEKKTSMLVPDQLRQQFGDRAMNILADRPGMSAVQVRQYRDRKNA